METNDERTHGAQKENVEKPENEAAHRCGDATCSPSEFSNKGGGE